MKQIRRWLVGASTADTSSYGGGDTLRMLKKYGGRVGYVHLKDVDGEILQRALQERWSFHRALKAFIFAKLGHGIVNIPCGHSCTHGFWI